MQYRVLRTGQTRTTVEPINILRDAVLKYAKGSKLGYGTVS
eukprot:CAMPEP_0185734576 /NCGR_PEP_ID=MMETSP1171-20130828/22928_1 /TAXON_ID=374046 /ORGANISM="Helicotheca tamensis, Strain CCMP826" /LENGTH=40 /DNA_ID= /DNA_START= /DNA_END= /DNA_ORIENTATION=